MTPFPPRSERAARNFAIDYALWLKDTYPEQYAAMKAKAEQEREAREIADVREWLMNAEVPA